MYTIKYMGNNIPSTPLKPGVHQVTQDSLKSDMVVESSTIRTMKGDVAYAIKNQNETLVSIALAEEKKQAAQRVESATTAAGTAPAIDTPAPKRIGRPLVVVVITLILAGLGLAYQFLLPKILTINIPNVSLPSFGNTTTGHVSVAPTAPVTPRVVLAPSLIPAHFEKRFIINKETTEKIFSDIAGERVVYGSTGKIKNLYFAEDLTSMDGVQKTVAISTNSLLILVGVSVPELLTRSLEAPFMVGLLNEESSTTATPFLILKISDYETSFAGMLEWEQNLPRLIDTIFGTNIAAGISNNTKTRDVILLGRDARVLEITPNVGIAYTFANKQTIIIAGSQTALVHILPLVK